MIIKEKILQVWDKEIDDVVMYCQTIINDYTKEKKEIKAKSLKELESLIDIQKKKWENGNINE